jgi:hypothetical protein
MTGVQKPGNHVIVLFGSTGDLARRKLLPGLFHLAEAGLLPDGYRIIGTSRKQLTDEEFRAHARAAVDEFGRRTPTDQTWEEFARNLHYAASDASDAGQHGAAVAEARAEIGGANRRQAERLALLSDWLHERDRKYLFELLVPGTAEQLLRVGGDPHRYDAEIRPGLVVQTLRELQDGGVEPDIWKIEGLDAREDCERVAEQARTGGRDDVACIVLGRGADEAGVWRWLEAGAGVPGYIGFAVGRTLWWDELQGYVAGALRRSEAAEQIADNYLRLIDAYAVAAVA